MRRKLILVGFLPMIIFPLTPIYAQGEYDEIEWSEVIKYMVSNFWLGIQLILDQPNVDRVYEQFAEFRNNYVFDGVMATQAELQALATKANDRIASKEFCQLFTPDKIKAMIKANVPYDKLSSYCDIPKELDGLVRDKLK